MPGAGAGILKKALISYRGKTDAPGTTTQLKCLALAAQPDFDNQEVVILSGNCKGQSKDIEGATTGGEVNVATAFDHVIASGVSFLILTMKPTVAEMIKLLQLRRSAQSGSKTLTNAYVAEYEDSDTTPWLFMGVWIDLTNMAGGDTVWIRVSTKGVDGGAYVVEDETSYTGVQPAGAKAIRIGSLPNVYGVKIEAYQSAGAPAYLSLDMEFFTAKR